MSETRLLGTATLNTDHELPVPIECINTGAIELREHVFWAAHQLIDALLVSPRYDQFRETFATMVIGATRTDTPRHIQLPSAACSDQPSPVELPLRFAPGDPVCFVEHSGLRKNDWWLVTTPASDWLSPTVR